MSAWESPIIRISTGFLNTVNETVIANQAGIAGFSKFAGQLGKTLWVDSSQIAALFNSAIGTLYAGRYRYVRRRAADDNSPALGVGKIVFWDSTVTGGLANYQITSDENLSSTANAVLMAGIAIGDIDPGSYGFIQDMGLVNVKFRSVLTASGAPGIDVYAAAVGDTGSDQGTADVLTTDSTAVANQRYLGNAIGTPAGSSLTQVLLNMKNTLLP